MKGWRDRSDQAGDIVSAYGSFGGVDIAIKKVVRSDGKVNWHAEAGIYPRVMPLASPDLEYAKAQAKAKLQVILQDALKELLEET